MAAVSGGQGPGPCPPLAPLPPPTLTLRADPMHRPVTATLLQLPTAARPCHCKGHTCRRDGVHEGRLPSPCGRQREGRAGSQCSAPHPPWSRGVVHGSPGGAPSRCPGPAQTNHQVARRPPALPPPPQCHAISLSDESPPLGSHSAVQLQCSYLPGDTVLTSSLGGECC